MLVGDGVHGGQPGSGRCVSLKMCLMDQEGMQEGHRLGRVCVSA